jgi:hypothetical protein
LPASQSLSNGEAFAKTALTGSATSTTMLSATVFTTLPVSCPITKFTFEDITPVNAALSIDSALCPTPDTSDACRTIIIPTHRARYANSPSPSYLYFIYKFTIEAEGGTTMTK